MKQRCSWAGSSELMIDYHDNEWGVPVHDDHRLFELLTLEGAGHGFKGADLEKSNAALFDYFDKMLKTK